MRNERKLEATAGIALARLGPTLVKNLSAITLGSVINFPSHLKDEGNEGLLVCLFITSFSNLQINLAFSNLGLEQTSNPSRVE